MRYIKTYNENLESEINKFYSKKGSKPVNKSKEEAWYKFLDVKLPAPAIIGEGNKVIDGELIEGNKVFYILDKNFEPLEEVSPVFISSNLNKEIIKILHKYGFSEYDIDILANSIEEAKMNLFVEFSLDNIEKDFKKESSPQFIQFEKDIMEIGRKDIS